ncbi:MAG: hypothetical protein GF333_00695 [Candidatus Omnitrophica bacterium]|nr:hypothetical protein [Candidatus Omnitrophota bacterium]
MDTVAFDDLIKKSITHTKEILFRPFSAKKWLKLILIGFLAGAVSYGGNFGSSSNYRSSGPAKKKTFYQQNEPSAAPAAVLTQGAYHRDAFSQPYNFLRNFFTPQVIISVSIVLTLALILILLFSWISSRFKFIWLNAIRHNETPIKVPWREFRHQGNSFFGFTLTMMAVWLVYFGGLAVWGFFSLRAAGVFYAAAQYSLWQIIISIGAIILLLIIGAVIFALIQALADHFVIPIMEADRCGFMEGAGIGLKILRGDLKNFLLFFLLMIAFGIVTLLATFVLVLLVLLFLLLVGLVLFGVPYLLFSATNAMPGFWIYAVIMGIPFVVLLYILMLSIQLPFAVFFRSFSLYFLSALDCGYTPLPLDHTPAPSVPS